MAGAESSKGLTWWPKLLLLGAVIVVGILYLGSVNKHEPKDQGQEAALETGEAVSATAGSTPSAPAEAGTEVTKEEAAPVETSAGVSSEPSAESVTVDQAVPAGEIAASPGGGAAETAASAGGGHPEEEATVAVETPAPPYSAAGEAGGDEAAHEVTPAEARAFAEAVMKDSEAEGKAPAAVVSTVPEAPAPEKPAGSVTATPEVTTPVPPVPSPAAVVPPQPSVQDSIEERRARIMAEYEAMRKRAEEAMRRRFEQRGMSAPYGYPGYAPGYYPQRQP